MIDISEEELIIAIEALEESGFQLKLRVEEVHPANKLTRQAMRDVITRFKGAEDSLKSKQNKLNK